MAPANADTGDLVVGRSDGDNMRWAAYRWNGERPTPNYFQLGEEQGHSWGDDRSVTAIAAGDIDNDGQQEVVVGRDGHGPGANMRWQAYRVFPDGIVTVAGEQGHGWGDSRGVSALAVGDVNGDGAEDVVIGRSDGDNMRWAAYAWDASEDFIQIGSEQGTNWGDNRSATAIAIGNFDGTDNLDVVVGRDGHGPGGGMRWQAYTLTDGDFMPLGLEQGGGWGDDRGVTALAAGDVDGDGLDEVIVGRGAGDNMRWAAYKWDGVTFQLFGSNQGESGGDDRGVTSLATGDVDGDGLAEVAVGRNDGDNMRWAVYEWNEGDFQLLGSEQGTSWGSSRSVTALSMGDVDGDGRDDVLIGRDDHGPGGNARWFAFRLNITATDFEQIGPEQGADWGDDRGVTAVLVITEDVDTDGDGLLDRWETSGIPGTNPPLITDPMHKDLIWEIDWISASDAPTAAQITALKNAFAAAPVDAGGAPNPDNLPGITLWIDTGGTNGGDDLGGGSQISSPLDLSGLTENFYAIKDSSFDRDRRATVRYMVMAGSAGNNTGTSTGGNSPTTLNDTTQAWLEDEWVGRTVTINGGTANGETCVVSSNTGTQLDVGGCSPLPNWAQTPGAGVPFMIIGDGSGTTTAGSTATTLVDATQAWTVNAFAGQQITLNGGDFPGNTCTITSNTATVLTISTCLGLDTWVVTPDNTSTYRIRTTGGQAELGGNDLIEFNHNAATIMHEMGHNLGLRHGGDVNANCKPPYVSIMNYHHQVGFPGSGQAGIPQVGGTVIIDFAPPLISTSGLRGLPVLGPINELNLVEPTILDPSDNANRAVFTNINGNMVQVTLNQPFNWNSDTAGDPPNEGPFAFNTDIPDGATGSPNCGNSGATLGFHQGFDDWSNIVLPIDSSTDSEDSAVNPVAGPEPTVEEQEFLGIAIATTDLATSKTAAPPVVIAGWDKVTYTVGVQNNGPNPADQAELVETLPTEMVPDLVPSGCELSGSVLLCALDPLNAYDDVSLTIRALSSAAPVFAAGHVPVPSVNVATAVTTLGPDPVPGNDAANANVALVGVVGNWIRFVDRGLVLSDQFAEDIAYVDPRPQAIITPAGVQGEPQPRLDGVHLAAYHLTPAGRAPVIDETIAVGSRFGHFDGRAEGPARWLLIPTGKSLSDVPVDVDTETQSVPHYACYDLELKVPDDQVNASLTFTDQFRSNRTHRVRLLRGLICNPAEKNGERIVNSAAPHLACFDVSGGAQREDPVPVTLRNQFGDHRAVIEIAERLCVAATKEHIEEQAGLPDLTIEPALPAPPSDAFRGFPGFDYCLQPPQGGVSQRIALVVRNLAPDPAGPSLLSVFFGNQPSPETVSIGPLAPGAGQALELPIPDGCFRGGFSTTCRFRMSADSADVLDETDETNNMRGSFCVAPAG